MTYLGLDVGTSSVKAILIDEAQQTIASADAALEADRPASGWSEQSPDDWVAGCELALDALQAEHGQALAAVHGIGLSGQMHGAVMLDAEDRPVAPCILWNDSRAAAQANSLDADPDFRRITGNITFAGFTAPKLMWMTQLRRKAFDRIRKVMLPKDYVRFWLTGEHATEMSDASGTGWLDMAERKWSPELIAKTGMRLDQMPPLIEGSDAAGQLRTALAERYGMKGPVTVAGGAADNPAAACGTGILQSGTAFVSLGTSGVLLAATDGFRPKAESAVHAFCHAVPQSWYQMGVILSATDSLGWLAKITGKAPGELAGQLDDALDPPSRIRFLPYLSGERTPINDAGARGAFLGLDHPADVEELTRAVLQGVAFAFKDCQEALASTGTELRDVLAVGGGTRSRYWLSMIATLLGRPLDLPVDGTVGAALGAARLGLIAANGADPRDVCTRPPIAATIEPVREMTDPYAASYDQWRRLYPAIKASGGLAG